jgi:hypothetical protein
MGGVGRDGLGERGGAILVWTPRHHGPPATPRHGYPLVWPRHPPPLAAVAAGLNPITMMLLAPDSDGDRTAALEGVASCAQHVNQLDLLSACL